MLEVCGLKTYFTTDSGESKAVDGIDFRLRAGQTLGLVGESGCGKSVTALSIMRLVPPQGRIVAGKALFEGRDLLSLDEKQMRSIRGNRISMVFQEPMTSLNPTQTVGSQVAEVFRIHRGMSRRQAADEAIGMLDLVRIPSPAKCAKEYPHRLSGGMRQRVSIAMALGCDPAALIADEPTTALDVTVQAQILMLMEELRRRLNSAVLLITHDLGVIAETADEVAVMYAGLIVEKGPVKAILDSPRHPYTRGLLRSMPRIGSGARLNSIPGAMPDASDIPPGCSFNPRCSLADRACCEQRPEITKLGDDHYVRCYHYDKED